MAQELESENKVKHSHTWYVSKAAFSERTNEFIVLYGCKDTDEDYGCMESFMESIPVFEVG